METEDRRHGKRYKQVFRENMSQKDEPVIRTVKKRNDTRQEWTKITFKPDYPRCVTLLVSCYIALHSPQVGSTNLVQSSWRDCAV